LSALHSDRTAQASVLGPQPELSVGVEDRESIVVIEGERLGVERGGDQLNLVAPR
jgi:hypothetical protein